MNEKQTQFDISVIQASWQAFVIISNLRPIRTVDNYDCMVVLMDALLDEAGDNENHPLASLLDLVRDLVSKYDQEH